MKKKKNNKTMEIKKVFISKKKHKQEMTKKIIIPELCPDISRTSL